MNNIRARTWTTVNDRVRLKGINGMSVLKCVRLLGSLVFLSLSCSAWAQTLPGSGEESPAPSVDEQGFVSPKSLNAPSSSAEPEAAAIEPAFTAPVVYVCDAIGRLATIDVDAKKVKVIGYMKLKGTTTRVVLTDIGFAPNGVLYGVSFTQFYRVNPSTGELTKIGTGLGRSGINALTFSKPTKTKPTQAVAASYKQAETGFYTINTTTGKATFTKPDGGFTSAGDFAWSGSHLYFAATGSSAANSRLVDYNYSLTPVTYTSHTVALTNLYGLAIVQPGVLIGFAGTKTYRIYPSTGATSLVLDFTNKGLTRINGAASKSFF